MDLIKKIKADIALGIPKTKIAKKYKIGRQTLYDYLNGVYKPKATKKTITL